MEHLKDWALRLSAYGVLDVFKLRPVVSEATCQEEASEDSLMAYHRLQCGREPLKPLYYLDIIRAIVSQIINR